MLLGFPKPRRLFFFSHCDRVRHCFALQDFFLYVGVPSLVKIWLWRPGFEDGIEDWVIPEGKGNFLRGDDAGSGNRLARVGVGGVDSKRSEHFAHFGHVVERRLGHWVERKTLRHQEVQRLLRHHTHALHKPASYFLEHPVFPQEDVEPLPVEKIVLSKEEVCFKMEIPTSNQSSKGGGGGSKRGQKTNQRRLVGRRGGGVATAAAPIVPGAHPVHFHHFALFLCCFFFISFISTLLLLLTSPSEKEVIRVLLATGIYPPSQPPPQWNSYGSLPV